MIQSLFKRVKGEIEEYSSNRREVNREIGGSDKPVKDIVFLLRPNIWSNRTNQILMINLFHKEIVWVKVPIVWIWDFLENFLQEQLFGKKSAGRKI